MQPFQRSPTACISIFLSAIFLSCVVLLGLKPDLIVGEQDIFGAVETGSTEAIKRVLASQPEALNQKGARGMTPLVYAVRTGKLAAVKLLLKLGASTDGKDGYTPLHVAGQFGQVEIAKVLVAHGLDPNDVWYKDYHSPLDRACHGTTAGHTEAAIFFMHQGVTPGSLSACFRDSTNQATRKHAKEELFKRDGIHRDELGRGILPDEL
jgi:hypothetical protein